MAGTGGTDARGVVGRIVAERADALVRLSHEVHADAELAFEEHRSSARVAQLLADGGFSVDHGVAGMDTAFVATYGTGSLHVAICAEYDALPGVGHACGHNVIAAAAAGAGLALAPLADELDLTVQVFGTPAEEGGGGKIVMLDAGLFDGVHAAMMVHPAPEESLTIPCLAVEHVEVTYRGKEAHASAYPQLGRNAADALTIAQVSVGLLRQHISSSQRIHGIVTHGGDAANIIPGRTTGTWYVRAATLAELEGLSPRVRRCFDAGALATGCEVEVELAGPPYSEFLPDATLLAAYEREATGVGRVFPDLEPDQELAGSTDMANVSLRVPTIHPMLGIDSDGAVNHQPEFTAACIRPSADRAVLDGASAMARTVIAVAEDPASRQTLMAAAAQR
jgi:amidohydrolase